MSINISKIHTFLTGNFTGLVKFGFVLLGGGFMLGFIAFGMETVVQIFVGDFGGGLMYLGLSVVCFYTAIGIIGVLKQTEKDGKIF